MARSFFNSKLWQGILDRLGLLETQVGTIPPAEDYNTVADVRAETTHNDGDRIFCLENQVIYIFDQASTEPDNGSTILKPDDISAGNPGRWVFESQLALKGHTHTDKADKITSPLQTRFLMSDGDGNPVESVYSPNSFAGSSHTHTGYATEAALQNLQSEVDGLENDIGDKMDKYPVQAGDVGKPAVFNSEGNTIPGNLPNYYEFTTGELTAGVTKTISHNRDWSTGYIINARTPDGNNNMIVQVLKRNDADPANAIDIKSIVGVPEPGLTIQIVGF